MTTDTTRTPWPSTADIAQWPDTYGHGRHPSTRDYVTAACLTCAHRVRVTVPAGSTTATVHAWMVDAIHDMMDHPCPSCRWTDDYFRTDHAWTMSYDDGRTITAVEATTRRTR